MKKTTIFSILTTVAGSLSAVVLAISASPVLGSADLAGSGQWVHYAQKDATPTENGIREYWVECKGNYQFTAPTGVTIKEGTVYDTSEFEADDPRWLTYVPGSVFYNLGAATPGYDYREVGTALDGYTAFTEVDKTKAGNKLNAIYVKDGSVSLMAEQLVISKFITTNVELTQSINCVTAGVTSITGYFVLANDLNNPEFGAGWSDPCWKNAFVGTLDGRGHTLINPYVSSSAGLFGGSTLSECVVKNLEFRDSLVYSYGLLGYNANGITFENCKITGKAGGTAVGLVGRGVQNVKFVDCYLDYTAMPDKTIISEVTNFTFTNTKVKRNTHSQTKLFDKSGGATYVENYDEPGVTWLDDNYVFLPAAEANFATGAHGDGYYCEHCDKYFTDANHKTEIAKEDFFTSDKLPSTHVDGKQVFYNLATLAFDVSEVPSVNPADLVDEFKQTPSLIKKQAGDTLTLYTVGSTNYAYDVVVITDVLDTETKFATACNAKDHDISGYYVLTKNLTNQITCSPGGSNTNTTGVNITIDGRGHTITYLKGSGDTGGIFGTNQNASFFNVTFKNMKITTYAGSYGLFGYAPANKAGTSLVLDNVDLTYTGMANYGTLGGVSSTRVVLRSSIIQFKAGQESYLFYSGANPTFENSTIILDDSMDATKPQLVIKGHTVASERTGLVSAISGLTFLNARP